MIAAAEPIPLVGVQPAAGATLPPVPAAILHPDTAALWRELVHRCMETPCSQ
jgi:hypothetical protein